MIDSSDAETESRKVASGENVADRAIGGLDELITDTPHAAAMTVATPIDVPLPPSAMEARRTFEHC